MERWYCTVLYYTVLSMMYTIPYCTILYYTILYHTVLNTRRNAFFLFDLMLSKNAQTINRHLVSFEFFLHSKIKHNDNVLFVSKFWDTQKSLQSTPRNHPKSRQKVVLGPLREAPKSPPVRPWGPKGAEPKKEHKK